MKGNWNKSTNMIQDKNLKTYNQLKNSPVVWNGIDMIVMSMSIYSSTSSW